MKEARGWFTCIIHPDTKRLYAIGGSDSDTYESVYVGTNSSDLANESWSLSVNKLLIQTQSAGSIIWYDSIYIIGGYDYDAKVGHRFLDQVQILNVHTGVVTASGLYV